MSKLSFAQVYRSPRILVVLLLGFSSGLPLPLTAGTLQAWMTESGVDLKTIAVFALVGLPYTVKYLWAPVIDRYHLPFLGRRRGWLVLTHIALMAAIFALGLFDPKSFPAAVAALAVLVTFLSASHDIVIDAYRTEILRQEEFGAGAAASVLGYRIALLVSGALALILADHLSWSVVYTIMAALMAVGLLTVLFAPEPEGRGTPPTLRAAVVEPFRNFFSRNGAFELLAFIILYKLGDVMAAALSTSFMLQVGFSKTQIGAVTKGFGLVATIVGALVGGGILAKLGLYRSLFLFGILQLISTAGFAILATVGDNVSVMTLVIGFENITGGMGTAAYTAFLMALCDRRFTGTQYALLSSLMAVSRTIAAAPMGYLVESLGWSVFFVVCCLAAIPGLLLLVRFKRWEVEGAPVN